MTPHEAETGMSFIITRVQKDELRRRGYSEEQIRVMKPEDAHRALGGLHYRDGDAQEYSGYAAASYSMEISLPV